MSRIFEIVPKTPELSFGPNQTRAFVFVVTNRASESREIRAITRASEETDEAWLEIQTPAIQSLGPGESTEISIAVTTGADAQDREYRFGLRVLAVKAPDDEWTDSSPVIIRVRVGQPAQTGKFPWWLALAGVAALVLIVVSVLLLTGGDSTSSPDAGPAVVDAGPPPPPPPPAVKIVDEITWADRKVKFDNIRLNGSATRELVVKPGQPFVISMNWSLTVARNSSIYCPTCIVQFYYGFEKNSVCYVTRVMTPGTTDRGTTQGNFTAPDKPGTYAINHKHGLDFRCGTPTFKKDLNNAIAVIRVE